MVTNNWKVDKIHIYLPRKNTQGGSSDELRQYRENEITHELIETIVHLIMQEQVSMITVENSTQLITMSIFAEGQQSQIGIVDEAHDVIYYYNNGSCDNTPTSIAGHEFKKWMVCSQIDILIAILKKFISTGEKLVNSAWNWCEESTW